MADWDARTYERISEPQYAWGVRVLERLPLRGDETVMDAGCGAGRVTERLAERLPDGRVVALDASLPMLERARARLLRFGDRVRMVRADLATHVERPPVDAIFSTATLHWVLDHDALFASLAASLRPGGRLVAQCGGHGNLARMRAHSHRLHGDPRFAASFVGFRPTWRFADAEETAARLARAGFVDVTTRLTPAPSPFADGAAYAEFVSKVVLRDELAALPDDAQRAGFVAAVVDAARADTPPFTLDYVRLDIDARLPAL